MFALRDFNRIGDLVEQHNWLNGARLVFYFNFSFCFASVKCGQGKTPWKKALMSP
jgi:hypothetical protein